MPADALNSYAASVIASGGVIAFRTDTFYGLGADPLNPAAVRKIWDLKGREEGKPILLLISDREQLSNFVASPSATFNKLANRLWPGPLTLIGLARSELPRELTAGTQTIGLRLPDDERVRRLVRACGGALTATSANPSQQAPAINAADVSRYFNAQVDLVLDDGTVAVTGPSTVVDVTNDEVRVVREGLITGAEIERALN
jgi:L-threonylcarbamoyladenylate synthase